MDEARGCSNSDGDTPYGGAGEVFRVASGVARLEGADGKGHRVARHAADTDKGNTVEAGEEEDRVLSVARLAVDIVELQKCQLVMLLAAGERVSHSHSGGRRRFEGRSARRRL